MSDTLPNGQMTLMEMPELPTAGSELLASVEEARERYPLTTVERDQERLSTIIRYLGAGVPKAEIMRSQRVGWHTLESIAVQHGQRIAEVKRRVAAKTALLVDATVDSLIDDVLQGRLEPRDKAVVLGIGVDKLQVLTGEPTVIHGTGGEAAKQFSVEALRARLGAAKHIIDVTPRAATGSVVGENLLTREGAGVGGHVVGSGSGAGGAGAAGDGVDGRIQEGTT